MRILWPECDIYKTNKQTNIYTQKETEAGNSSEEENVEGSLSMEQKVRS